MKFALLSLLAVLIAFAAVAHASEGTVQVRPAPNLENTINIKITGEVAARSRV